MFTELLTERDMGKSEGGNVVLQSSVLETILHQDQFMLGLQKGKKGKKKRRKCIPTQTSS